MTPGVLESWGLLGGFAYTGYPETGENLTGNQIEHSKSDNNTLITGDGPAAAILLALEVVKHFSGEKFADELAHSIQFDQ
jgi:putative intracellular protease/amidase